MEWALLVPRPYHCPLNWKTCIYSSIESANTTLIIYQNYHAKHKVIQPPCGSDGVGVVRVCDTRRYIITITSAAPGYINLKLNHMIEIKCPYNGFKGC